MEPVCPRHGPGDRLRKSGQRKLGLLESGSRSKSRASYMKSGVRVFDCPRLLAAHFLSSSTGRAGACCASPRSSSGRKTSSATEQERALLLLNSGARSIFVPHLFDSCFPDPTRLTLLKKKLSLKLRRASKQIPGGVKVILRSRRNKVLIIEMNHHLSSVLRSSL